MLNLFLLFNLSQRLIPQKRRSHQTIYFIPKNVSSPKELINKKKDLDAPCFSSTCRLTRTIPMKTCVSICGNERESRWKTCQRNFLHLQNYPKNLALRKNKDEEENYSILSTTISASLCQIVTDWLGIFFFKLHFVAVLHNIIFFYKIM